MPTKYAFFCIVPWAGPIRVATSDMDDSMSGDSDHPFRKQQLKLPIGGREILGKMYFAREVRDSEWVTIRQLVADALTPKRGTGAHLRD